MPNRPGKHSFPTAEPTTRERGYDYAWQKVRRIKLLQCPLCEDCNELGIVKAAEDIHHLIPINANPSLRLELSNLRSLCKECHAKRHGKDCDK